MFHVMFCSSVKRIFAPSGDGAETPDLATPSGRLVMSGAGGESQVAASNELPQGRTPHTQDPSPAVGVNGTGLCGPVPPPLTGLRQRDATVAVNKPMLEGAATTIFREASTSFLLPGTRSMQGLAEPRGVANGSGSAWGLNQHLPGLNGHYPRYAIHARLLLACCRREHSPVGRGAGEPSSTMLAA